MMAGQRSTARLTLLGLGQLSRVGTEQQLRPGCRRGSSSSALRDSDDDYAWHQLRHHQGSRSQDKDRREEAADG
ncbi:hypothetical protein NL676_020439 [Syzygium grande]|nr:hypothetical protein NL676_020439 [Syzygium grande]